MKSWTISFNGQGGPRRIRKQVAVRPDGNQTTEMEWPMRMEAFIDISYC